MNRRALLSSLGCLACAGCLGGDDAGRGTGTTNPDEPESTTHATTIDSTPVTDSTETDSTDSTETAEPETPDVGVPPSEAAGPPWDHDVTRVVSWAEASDGAPIRLYPSTQNGSLPETSLSFTLTNETSVRFAFNPYGWAVWKRVDGAWFRIAPEYWPEPLQYLPPGESHTWDLTVDNARLGGDPIPHAQGRRSLTLVGLGGGTYAFAVDGWFATEDYDAGLGFAARFELDGPAVELAPTNEVTATTREGDAVVVETDVEGGEDDRLAAFDVTRADDGSDDARRLVTEQALRDRTLRNTLPFFEEGVRTVRLVERNSTVPPFGVHGTEYVEYEGERYRITAAVIESTETAAETETGAETTDAATRTAESGE